jgi:hypothetical protein
VAASSRAARSTHRGLDDSLERKSGVRRRGGNGSGGRPFEDVEARLVLRDQNGVEIANAITTVRSGASSPDHVSESS